jgi:hypothetical protein
MLQKFEQLGNQTLPSLNFQDLEHYSEEELTAIETFLKKSLESIGSFYQDYGKLLQSVSFEYEKSSDEILGKERTLNDQMKAGEIRDSLKKK